MRLPLFLHPRPRPGPRWPLVLMLVVWIVCVLLALAWQR
jgi:hypothetical protein